MTHLPQTAETTTTPLPGAAPLSAGVGHYENFPVASLLCPPALRPAVMAIYHFARTADDIADEGDADATQRLAELAAYRQALQASVTSGEPLPTRWNGVFAPLREAAQQRDLPAPLLHDLISAFEQDVRHTAAGHHYADTAELLDYCRLSANPVGRLLLHLYGVNDTPSLARSDQICSALQLINFWQDISVDLPRQRHYLPTDLLQRHGLPREAFDAGARPDAATQVRMAQAVAALCAQARALMQQGAPLARRIPGRAGWELRLVIQGGLLILDKIAALQHRSWQQRPRVGALDLPRLVWRALCMR
ncbi:squalene synthase HpnC [Hydrogenophaga taeniospiralis]|uniref:squalene synthase HpnC n=1 Tax=Hydrogenophaga taeniospiralis TaxID=65656 RepID=UPI001CF9807C|nr:squalene synthase HpnC [Hydrogenophaga taeniospiralis]UCU96288.1 squalene synthase HpnC [Hydrogenophaga taeniospiralis]